MRVIVILILIVIAIGMLRSLVTEMSRAAVRGWKKGQNESKAAGGGRSGGKLVQDPETGAYVDPASAVRADIDGKTFYFESGDSRDRFLQRRKA